MITVSVHAAVEYPHIAKCYAALLQEWKNGGPLAGWLGNEGEWEENARLRGSFVSKIHIRLPDEPSWPPSMPSAARKSDSYLVYTRHFLHPDRYQIISIMSPKAHELAKTSFMAVLEKRAEDFQSSI